MKRSALAVVVVVSLVTGLTVLSLTRGAAPPAAAQGLLPYEGCDPLLAHHREALRAAATPWGTPHLAYADGPTGVAVGAAVGVGRAVAGAPLAAAAGAAQDAGAAVGRGGTGTNLQEQDVDEPDRAKLRDGRLVVLSSERTDGLRRGRDADRPVVVPPGPRGPGR